MNLVASISLAVVMGQVAHSKLHRVVVEVNVPGNAAYGTVLNNALNLKKAFAPELVRIEVVCHGEGIGMLLVQPGRVNDLIRKAHDQKIEFVACNNTLRGKKIDRKKLYPFVQIVPSGVAEVVHKQEDGWSYLKGAY